MFKCAICGNDQYKQQITVKEMMFGTRKEYDYFQCGNCEALQIAEPIRDPELLYPGYYYSFSSTKKSFKQRLKKIFYRHIISAELGSANPISKLIRQLRRSMEAHSLIKVVSKNNSILDVGCGSGELIEAMFDLGFKKVKGVDPYINATIVSPEGWSVEKKFITELDETEKFDVIMLHHSFEHMENPLEVLKKIKQILNPSGICLIRIPVCDSYAFLHYKQDWVQLDAPRHITLHTNKSMKILADGAELLIEEIISDSTAYQFIASEQYRNKISLNDPASYYQPFYKKFRTKGVSSQKLRSYKQLARDLNKKGEGDQRIFILKRNS